MNHSICNLSISRWRRAFPLRCSARAITSTLPAREARAVRVQIENRKSKILSSGFTIVELLMVVAIISVLITITVSAISGSMKRARARRAEVLCTMVEQGIATYYAQKGEWPKEPKDPNKQDSKDSNGSIYVEAGEEYYLYEEDEANDMIKKVVKQAKDNPMIDVSGLFVARKGQAYGMDFLTAIHGSRRNSSKMKLSEMVFGYPDVDTGRFRRFVIKYYPTADKVTVSQKTQ